MVSLPGLVLITEGDWSPRQQVMHYCPALIKKECHTRGNNKLCTFADKLLAVRLKLDQSAVGTGKAGLVPNKGKGAILSRHLGKLSPAMVGGSEGGRAAESWMQSGAAESWINVAASLPAVCRFPTADTTLRVLRFALKS